MSQLSCGCEKFTSSVAKQLIVGLTGVLLVLFILGHLAGNLLIYGGPEVFNHYAAQLQSLGELLWVIRLGLLSTAVLHVVFTIWLVLSNRQAREQSYAVQAHLSDKTFATRIMIYSGLVLFFFIFLHLYDFSFQAKTGPATMVDGVELELYGLVWNAFSNPIHSLIYILAVAAVGLHLTHAVSSVWVTLGVLSDRATRKADLAAKIIGGAVFLGFASIPVYVMVSNLMGGQS